MPQHNDQVGPHPICYQRHHDRHPDKHHAFASALVAEVGEQAAHSDGRDQVTDTAAGLHHRPCPRRDDELQTFTVHRDTARPQGQHGEVSGPLHEVRQKKIPNGYGKKQKPQGKGQNLGHVPAQHGGHGQNNERHQGQLGGRVHGHQVSRQPEHGRAQHQQPGQPPRPRHHGRQYCTLAPHQPQRDKRHHKAVRVGLGTRPDHHHTPGRMPVRGQNHGLQQDKNSQGSAPMEGNRNAMGHGDSLMRRHGGVSGPNSHRCLPYGHPS